MTSKRAAPLWLTAIWEQRRTETATRIARAVTKLRSDGREVTYSSICAAVRAIDGRMGKKLDPIENAGFRKTCLSCAGQRNGAM